MDGKPADGNVIYADNSRGDSQGSQEDDFVDDDDEDDDDDYYADYDSVDDDDMMLGDDPNVARPVPVAAPDNQWPPKASKRLKPSIQYKSAYSKGGAGVAYAHSDDDIRSGESLSLHKRQEVKVNFPRKRLCTRFTM